MKSSKVSLDQLLRRSDVWRGESGRFVKQQAIDTGFTELNNVLQHQGWPAGCLIEMCQDFYASEWWLFRKAIKKLLSDNNTGYMALLNPPLLPFTTGLGQLGIPSRNLIIIQTKTSQDLVYSFTELSKSAAFSLIFAWQQKNTLHYNQLRKIQLSCADQAGIHVLFRHSLAKHHSSPASLRFEVVPCQNSINVHIFKQRGRLQKMHVDLSCPLSWQSLPPHSQLLEERDTLFYQTHRAGKIALFPKIKKSRKQDSSHEYH